MSQLKSKAKIEAAHDAMDAYLSATYSVWAENKPLALKIRDGIGRLLKDSKTFPASHTRCLGGLLRKHANSEAYYRSIIAGGPRYRLDGTPEGEITEDQVQTAMEKLAKKIEKVS